MIRKSLYGALILLIASAWLSTQENELVLRVFPGFELPTGPSASTGDKLFTYGGSVLLSVDRPFSGDTPLFLSGVVDFSMIGTEADTNLTLFSAGAGPGARFQLAPKLSADLTAAAGWGFGVYSGDSGSNPMGLAKGTLAFVFSPGFSLGLNTTYKYLHDIYNGFGVGLSAGFSPGTASARSKLMIPTIRLDPVFPVFYSWYDENQIGTAVIQNHENGPIKNVRVSLLVKQFMDSPKLCGVFPSVARAEEIRVPLKALFTENILSITEGSKAAADVTVEYEYMGTERVKTEAATIQIFDRNAMTWDDDRKAASFVTAKDPAVLRFSKQIAGETRSIGTGTINTNFRIGMGMFQALSPAGINYVVDPNTPYADLSQNKSSLDYLQFPRQTLSYKAGDCDDLSILYAALLKSVGMEAAFITVPGHIYTAFRLDMNKETAERTFLNTEDLIFVQQQTWLPVEITMIHEGFLAAWQKGAAEWRSSEKERGFYPIEEAWAIYRPVGSPGGDQGEITPPAVDELRRNITAELDTFVGREVEGRAAELKRRIARANNPAPLTNRLGVLYARYGLHDKAEIEFKKTPDYLPCMTNLENIYFLRQDMFNALSWYNKALLKDPDNKTAMLGATRANYELENYGSARRGYARLQSIDAELAAAYAYLASRSDEEGRASSALRESVVWEE